MLYLILIMVYFIHSFYPKVRRGFLPSSYLWPRSKYGVALMGYTVSFIPSILYNTSDQSASLNPVKTKLSPINNGRFTNIPLVARSFNCSSSDI